jgi:hypothetical protein
MRYLVIVDGIVSAMDRDPTSDPDFPAAFVPGDLIVLRVGSGPIEELQLDGTWEPLASAAHLRELVA